MSSESCADPSYVIQRMFKQKCTYFVKPGSVHGARISDSSHNLTQYSCVSAVCSNEFVTIYLQAEPASSEQFLPSLLTATIYMLTE